MFVCNKAELCKCPWQAVSVQLQLDDIVNIFKEVLGRIERADSPFTVKVTPAFSYPLATNRFRILLLLVKW